MPPTFLWVLKFYVKLGFGEHNFRNYPMCVSFQIFGSKSRYFFDGYQRQNEICERSFENFDFLCWKNFFFVFLWGVLIVAPYLTLFLFFLLGFKICFFRRILKRFFFLEGFYKEFWGIEISFGGGFNFRLGTCNVPSGSSDNP